MFEIVRAYDDTTDVLASAPFDLAFDAWVPMAMTVSGARISAKAGESELSVTDTGPRALADGGIGLLVADGAASANLFHVGPVQ